MREITDRSKPHCFELYASGGADIIKACKTDSEGKVSFLEIFNANFLRDYSSKELRFLQVFCSFNYNPPQGISFVSVFIRFREDYAIFPLTLIVLDSFMSEAKIYLKFLITPPFIIKISQNNLQYQTTLLLKSLIHFISKR